MHASDETRNASRSARTMRRGVVLLPVVLLSASWTVSVAGVGGVPRAEEPTLERPVVTPVAPVDVPDVGASPPASVARLGRATGAHARTVVPSAGGSQIPPVALAAYQRAAAVIGAADEGCHLQWPLVAAIGRIESDHGRVGGAALGSDGVARPAIVGPRLDGNKGTRLVSDSDGGRYDGDKSFDRAVGPLQFIPTTWGLVGVDADSDGVRDPQDVDDAALATAVHLCSGELDLARRADLRKAVLRYNSSGAYADAVLAVMAAYASGERATTVPAGYVVPGRGVDAGADSPAGRPSASEHHPLVADGRTDGAGQTPVREQGPKPNASPDPVATPTANPVVQLLTRTQAVLTCTLRGLSQLLQPARFQACVDDLMKR